LTVLPHLTGVDGVVTDPPYGINYSHGKVTSGKWKSKHHQTNIAGDSQSFNPLPWLRFPCVLWGANNFAGALPQSGWLVWDKRSGVEDVQFSMGEAEVAYCSTTQAVRVFRHLWFGLCRDSEVGEHYHPTQKPVALMQWCLGFIRGDVNIEPCPTILDPFMGSGTTGVACIRTGRRFIGVEIEPKYCAIAVERMERELSQPCLPTMEPERAKQEVLI
jgi:DNA modification methylase